MQQRVATNPSSLRFFAFDSDGCLFPNEVWEGVTVNGVQVKPKIRSYYDGQGISLMRALGIRICVITNERYENAFGVRSAVKKWNDLPSCRNGHGEWPQVDLFEGYGGARKLMKLRDWLAEHGGALSECGAMGDDLVDVPMLKAVGFAAAPASAEKSVKAVCDFVSERDGGHGAIRDLANFLVGHFGKDPLELPFE